MRTVTKENLTVQIDRLYKIKDEQGQLSMNGEYTLQAYKMLLATMDSEPVAEITEDLGRLFVKIHYPTTLKAGDKLYRHAEQTVAATGNGLNVALSLTQMQIDWICNTCASIYNTRNDDVAQGYIDEIRATLERHAAMLNQK